MAYQRGDGHRRRRLMVGDAHGVKHGERRGSGGKPGDITRAGAINARGRRWRGVTGVTANIAPAVRALLLLKLNSARLRCSAAAAALTRSALSSKPAAAPAHAALRAISNGMW